VENRVLVELDARLAGYDEARGRQVYAAVVDRLRALPGVESTGFAATVPFGISSMSRGIRRTGGTGAAQAEPLSCSFNIVGADYFQTLGIPLLRGRFFHPAEASAGAPAVVILDRLAARRLWPDGDAVGKHIRMSGKEGGDPDFEVVGVVGDVRERVIGRGEEPHVYVPFGREYASGMHIHLRTASGGPDPARFLGAVRKEIGAVDGRLPVLGVKSLRTHVESSIDYWIVRTGAQMFSVFGGIALLLAMIGLYGVRTYNVARRTREIGIRMALGAGAADALRMVLREGLQLMAVGAGIGLLLSLLVGKLLAGLLFEVNGADPLVFSVSALLLGTVSLLACYFPARRAARIDPMVALRQD
jgi:predicted permease